MPGAVTMSVHRAGQQAENFLPFFITDSSPLARLQIEAYLK